MGDGLPLGRIANNDIVELDVDFELTPAQARLLAKVLGNNTSLKRLDLQWHKLDEESKNVLLDTWHGCIVTYGLVDACEKGDMDGVKAMVEGHDVEKTGMSVEEMVSKKGKNSRGTACTPLQMAVKNEQFEIVQYLVKTCPKVNLIGQTDSGGLSSLHYAASDSKKNVQMLQFLIDNYNGNIKTIINQKHKNGSTPLDCAYASTMNPPIKKEIVSLLRKYGGKANRYDKNGNKVGNGIGDLND